MEGYFSIDSNHVYTGSALRRVTGDEFVRVVLPGYAVIKLYQYLHCVVHPFSLFLL